MKAQDKMRREGWNKDKLPKIPALTMSGGFTTEPEFALEFRVWIHPASGGEDFYLRYETLKEAIAGRKRMVNGNRKERVLPSKDYIEPVCAVVWRNKEQKYCEVGICGKPKKK